VRVVHDAAAEPHNIMVPIGELTQVETGAIETSIYHKNLKRVLYVTCDVAGKEESPVYAISSLCRSLDKIHGPGGYSIERYATHLPFLTDKFSMKWDGEWSVYVLSCRGNLLKRWEFRHAASRIARMLLNLLNGY